MKAFRSICSLSQRALADLMEVSQATIYRWELGQQPIDILKLARSAKEINTTTDWIILGSYRGMSDDLVDKLREYMGNHPMPLPAT